MPKLCKHGWTKGLPPLSQFYFAFEDPMHGFNNECEYESAMYNDYAEELTKTLKLRYAHVRCAGGGGVKGGGER